MGGGVSRVLDCPLTFAPAVLQHIVNWLVHGAPAWTNSSKFEATLRIYISRILKCASSNHNVLRDIVSHLRLRTLFALLRSKGGALASALANAAVLPARRLLLARCAAVGQKSVLSEPLDERPGPAYISAIRSSWSSVPGNVGSVAGTLVNFERARFFGRAWISRLDEHFAAHINVRATVELNPASSRFNVPAAVADELRDDAAVVKLARVLAIFYLPPPTAGLPSDGFPPAPAAGDAQVERMFVLVHPFADQVEGDTACMRAHGLLFHAIRHPAARPQSLPGAGAAAPLATPWVVFPLSEVLRAVRVFPGRWSDLASDAARLFAEKVEERKQEAAATRGSVLVFIPPLRGTRWPMLAPPPDYEAEEDD